LFAFFVQKKSINTLAVFSDKKLRSQFSLKLRKERFSKIPTKFWNSCVFF
jgi:hypothetical protein